jgi:hypothetical protein
MPGRAGWYVLRVRIPGAGWSGDRVDMTRSAARSRADGGAT